MAGERGKEPILIIVFFFKGNGTRKGEGALVFATTFN
jgi:hypothetical protein